ncbi:PARP-domain-containing protein [Meredithblackwellia eburnea MCA 4105]
MARGKRKPSPSPSTSTTQQQQQQQQPVTATKMVKTTRKGSSNSPPVDDRFPFKTTTHVYQHPTTAIYFDAMLNQTEIGKNANKFYVVQVIQSDDAKSWWCFNVWGRVGENGQNKVFGPFNTSGPAVAEFEKKFKDKTKLPWSNRTGSPQPGKYTYLERSFDDDDNDDQQEEEEEETGHKNKKAKVEEEEEVQEKKKPIESELDERVQDLMRMIFNTGIIDQTMTSLEYDSAKLPLGKLSKSTLDQGYTQLKDIATIVNLPAGERSKKENKDELMRLTNRYYSLVPHSFGRNKPPLIDNQVLLKRELDLMDALGQLKITSELMSTPSSKLSTQHPLDVQFANLGLDACDPVEVGTKEWGVLESLLANTKGVTHTSWSLSLLTAFRIHRASDHTQFLEGGFDKPNKKKAHDNKRLLWHGSRCSNFGGILSQGLRIAPPEAPVSGYMFGKGIYLASMSSKSAGYCFHSISNDEGLLMLVEAQLGPKPFYLREQAEYDAGESCKKAGMLATWGIGRTQPSAWEDAGKLHADLKGVLMPSTTVPPKEANKTSSLLYDEFITYSTSQVRIRYVLRCKFNLARW